MKLSHFSQTAVMSFALVLGLAAVPKLQVTAFTSQLVLAQTNSEFELPQTVAEGTEVRIDGSSSMEVTNTGLKQDFEAQYPQTAVTTNYSGSDAALEALKQGDIDLAAVGRGLTDSEKAEGFSESNVGRSKIAIIVGPDSPFQGSLTTEQFAQIFRGEITNWEEVGGPSAPIQLIDRPESSDTRRAFQNYPVFQSAPFQAGDSAVQVENETEAVIAQLGTEGIGYAIVNQVENQPGARIVPMHQVLPDVPEYPFSQPLAYVYRGAEPSEPGKAFLGYATTPEAERQVVATATPEEAATTEATETETTETETAATTETETTEPETAATTGTETIETAENLPEEAETSVAQSAQGSVATEARGGGFPWWLLLLPLLAIPLLLFRRKGEAETVAAPATRPTPAAPPPVVPQQESRVILTPRDCRDAYAYWELSDADQSTLRRAGYRPSLRLADVTDLDISRHQPHSVEQFECDPNFQDMHLPIANDNRDYLVQLGYTANDGGWVPLAQSEPVRVPQCSPDGQGLVGMSGDMNVPDVNLPSVDVPRPGVPNVNLPEVTAPNVNLPNVNIPDVKAPNVNVPDVKMPNVNAPNVNLPDVNVPNVNLPDVKTPNLNLRNMAAGAAGAAAAAGAAGAAAAGGLGSRIGRLGSQEDQIILVPRSSNDVYAYWEVSDEQKERFRRQGGRDLKLRLYDVTDIDLDRQQPHSIREFDCSEQDCDRHMPIYNDNRDYLVELGYLTNDGRWLRVARSAHVHVPSDTTAQTTGTQDSGTTTRTIPGSALPGAAAAGAAVTGAMGSRIGQPGVKDATAPQFIGQAQDNQIILVPRNSNDVYAYWEVSDEQKTRLRQQGGRDLKLRLYDVTDIDIDFQQPHSIREFDCSEQDCDRHMPIYNTDRDYLVELGYLTSDGRWLRVARSLHIHVPADLSSQADRETV